MDFGGTSKLMSRYEKAKVIGLRAIQISKNSPVMIDPKGETNPRIIALMELRNKKLPFKIRRRLPDNTYIDISVNDLIVY
jgi:DNA-directed RNA polymerase I, II, and III subunit RPABC2